MEYIYTRDKEAGVYKVNNPDRVDGSGNQIYLAKEVEALFPNEPFTMHCNDTELKFVFNNSITKATLDTAVSDHQNNN